MEKLDKLRAKAARYRKLARQMTDQRLVDVLEELASEYEQLVQEQPDGVASWAEGEARGPGSSGRHRG